MTSLVDVATHCRRPHVVHTCMTSLKQLPLESEHVHHELEPEAMEVSLTPTPRKKIRAGNSATAVGAATSGKIAYSRVRVILEALNARANVVDSHSMTAVLFRLLKT